MSAASVMRDLLDEAAWEYVIAKRLEEDAWGALRQAEIEFERLMAEFRKELLQPRAVVRGVEG